MFKSKQRSIVIPQSEHLRLAGTLAFLWGNKDYELPDVDHLSLVTGVGMHDRGYGVLDVAPVGEVSEADWIEITRRGFYMRWSDPVADLIAKNHLLRLASHGQSPDRKSISAEFGQIIRQMINQYQFSEALFARIDRITDFCDSIAFDFCFEQSAEGNVVLFPRNNENTETPTQYTVTKGTIRAAPWPFSVTNYRGYITGYQLNGYPEVLDPVLIPWELSIE